MDEPKIYLAEKVLDPNDVLKMFDNIKKRLKKQPAPKSVEDFKQHLFYVERTLESQLWTARHYANQKHSGDKVTMTKEIESSFDFCFAGLVSTFNDIIFKIDEKKVTSELIEHFKGDLAKLMKQAKIIVENSSSSSGEEYLLPALQEFRKTTWGFYQAMSKKYFKA